MSSSGGSGGFKVAFAHKTDIGKARQINEDSKLVEMWPDGSALLAVVADGLGGHSGGEQASGIAVDILKQMLQTPIPPDPQQQYELLLAKIYEAHQAIEDYADKNPELAGMGATIVAAIISELGMVHLYAGDCRLYLFRENHLVYITQDHTVMQVLLASGQLQPEQVRAHPMRATVTSCLGAGMSNRLTIDPKWASETSNPNDPSPHIPLQPNDLILLSSDGFHGEVPESTIESLARDQSGDLDRFVDEAVTAALDNGGPDNITVVGVRYG